MERNSLEQQANLAAQKNAETQIEELENEIKKLENEIKNIKNDHIYNLKQDYLRTNERKFAEHYGCGVEETYHKYATRLVSCCKYGGYYKWWLPTRYNPYKDYAPASQHITVENYQKAQPTQQELDAYWVIHGEEMIISKTFYDPPDRRCGGN